MCGIFFSIGLDNPPASVIDSITYRGPDGRGWNHFTSPKGPVIMAHRRLSIIDLSPDGHQPMSTKDGRFWITYNGEIYNYLEIRKELESLGHVFVTKTDTEVLLNSYCQWGSECLDKLNGMFSFVIWDDQEKSFFAARDRFGVKPLYCYTHKDKIAFSSEIKQFMEIPGFKSELNESHLSFLMAHRYHPISSSTLFKNVCSIEPGHYLWSDQKKTRLDKWYEPHAAHLAKDYEETFLRLFEDAVSKRMIADVPVGALLSGGIDSSSIVCMIASLIKKDCNYKEVETFTSWSEDPSVDEKIYSDAVIEKTGFINHISNIKEDSFQFDIEKIIYHQEEPFFSTSIHSEWGIYKTISEITSLKVILDGQGADELACGYLFMIPHLLASYIKNGKKLTALREFYSTIKRHALISAKTLGIDILLQTYPRFLMYIQKMRRKKPGCPKDPIFKTFHEYTLYLIRRAIEPQLRWQDRSSMAFSIESRQPFLDYRLVEFLLSLPEDKKFSKGTTKIIIRDSMKGLLPDAVRKRVSKFGFPSPQNTLMNNFDPKKFNLYFKKGRKLIEQVNLQGLIDLTSKNPQDKFFIFSLGLWADLFKIKA